MCLFVCIVCVSVRVCACVHYVVCVYGVSVYVVYMHVSSVHISDIRSLYSKCLVPLMSSW